MADIVTTVFEQADRLDLQAERQHADAEQSNSAKMDALERLSRGIAHDLNNLLGAASLSAQRLRDFALRDYA